LCYLEHALERLLDVRVIERRAGERGEDPERHVLEAPPKFVGLLVSLKAPKRLCELPAHVDGTAVAALRCADLTREDRSLDAQLAPGKVDDDPQDRNRLTRPNPGASHQQEQREEVQLYLRGDAEEVLKLLAVERLDLLLPRGLRGRQA